MSGGTLEALRQSEHNFRTIIERSPLPTCVSTGTQVLYANQAMLEYLGYNEPGLVGPSLRELADAIVHPEDRARTREAFMTLFASIEPGQSELSDRFVRLDDVRLIPRGGDGPRYCDMYGVTI